MKNKRQIILVVCRGNITRSPFAEEVINSLLKNKKLDDKFVAISRGIQGSRVDPIPVRFPNITFYEDQYNYALPTLKKLGIDITKNVSKPVTEEDVKKANLVIGIEEKNRKSLLELFPSFKYKIHKLSEFTRGRKDFRDPETTPSVERHRKILTDIRDAIIEGLPKILELANKTEKN